jgi:hypothetical protein
MRIARMTRIVPTRARTPIAIVALLLGGTLHAQSPAPSASREDINFAFSNFEDIFGGRLIAAFDSIPAAKYNYRPTPSQQTIGYIAQHLEGANYGLCERLGELKHTWSAKDSLPDSVSNLLAFETDLAEHYSQLSTYMRLLNMVPPSALKPRLRTAIDLPDSALSQYVGVYQLARGLEFDVSMREGVLYIRSSLGNPPIRLWPETSKDFFVKEVDAQVTFTRDANGSVTGLVRHQFNRDRFAAKIK